MTNAEIAKKLREMEREYCERRGCLQVSVVRNICTALDRDDPDDVYWVLINNYDKIRADEVFHPMIAKTSGGRKFFKESLEFARKFGWTKAIEYYNKVLEEAENG